VYWDYSHKRKEDRAVDGSPAKARQDQIRRRSNQFRFIRPQLTTTEILINERSIMKEAVTTIVSDHSTLTIYNEIINVIPFIDPDTTRMVEWIWARRFEKGLSSHSLSINVPKDSNIDFQVVIDALSVEFQVTYTSPVFFRGLSVNEERDTVHAYAVAEVTSSATVVHMFGDHDTVVRLHAAVDAIFVTPKSILIENLMGFAQDGRAISNTKKLLESEAVFPNDAFYPWLEEGIDAFIQGYKNSPSSVLVLFGCRGTGKSSFLRKLLFALEGQNNGLVTSDAASLNPSMIGWLSEKADNGVIAFEDADNLVLKREAGNNQMSGILNMADGVIDTKLKLIISTNLSSLSKVDEALVRDGRAYRVLTFRLLTPDEANNARMSIGMPPIAFPERKEGYTLAEALHYSGELNIEERKAPQIGFAKTHYPEVNADTENVVGVSPEHKGDEFHLSDFVDSKTAAEIERDLVS
jgi:hypothetical protein